MFAGLQRPFLSTIPLGVSEKHPADQEVRPQELQLPAPRGALPQDPPQLRAPEVHLLRAARLPPRHSLGRLQPRPQQAAGHHAPGLLVSRGDK